MAGATLRDYLSGQRKSQKPRRNFVQENVRQLKGGKKHWHHSTDPITLPKHSDKFSSISKLMWDPKAGHCEHRPRFSTARFGPKIEHFEVPTARERVVPTRENCRPSVNLSLGRVNKRREGEGVQLPLYLRESNTAKANETPKAFRNQGSQTVEESRIDSLEYEGVIRYPSSRVTGSVTSDRERNKATSVREMGLQTTPQQIIAGGDANTQADALGSDQTMKEALKGAGVDFVKLNAVVQLRGKSPTKLSQPPDFLKPPPHYQKGVIPRYLREQKKDNKAASVDGEDPECPEGHVKLAEDDRKEYLSEIRKNYAEMVKQLNMLPVRTDTLKQRQKKIELEKELDRLEAGIKLFSREKMFIKIQPETRHAKGLTTVV